MSNSIFKYLSPAEQVAVKARDLSKEIAQSRVDDAINDNLLGELLLEDGYYRMNPVIPETMRVRGTGWGFLRHSPYTWKCAIFNRTPATPAITIAPGVYHQGVHLSDFAIVGHGSCSAVPNANTDDGLYFSGEAQHIFERLQVWGCGGNGMRAYGITDKTIISRCKISNCAKSGVRIARDLPGDALNHVSILQCEIDSNYGDGLTLWGNHGINAIDNTIQGNKAHGISIVPGDLLTPQVITGMNITLNYIESNTLGGIYGKTHTKLRTAHAYGVSIQNNNFIQPNGAPDIQLLAVDGPALAANKPWRGSRVRDNYHSGKHTWVDLGDAHEESTVLELPQYVGMTFEDLFKGLGSATIRNKRM